MQYLLMIYDEEKHWQSWDQSTRDKWMERYYTLVEDLKAEGVFLGGERLLEISSATSVRVRNGETMLSDGPFAETKEQLGGFFLVDCRDLDHATQVAARIPTSEIGTIEVRPLWYQPEA